MFRIFQNEYLIKNILKTFPKTNTTITPKNDIKIIIFSRYPKRIKDDKKESHPKDPNYKIKGRNHKGYKNHKWYTIIVLLLYGITATY